LGSYLKWDVRPLVSALTVSLNLMKLKCLLLERVVQASKYLEGFVLDLMVEPLFFASLAFLFFALLWSSLMVYLRSLAHSLHFGLDQSLFSLY